MLASIADPAAYIAGLTKEQKAELDKLIAPELRALWDWTAKARPNQLPPPGDWLTWLVLAGRGFGKTRCGAEWIREEVTSKRAGRIALIAETQKDLEEVMVFGDSGIWSVFPRDQKPKITKKPIRVEFHTGAVAFGYNATEPDQLRGPQFDAAWCLTGDTLVRMGDDSERPIKDVRPGDWVQTRSGPKRVLAQALTRQNSEVLRLSTVGGQTISGTADHPVWVQGRGFTPFASLQAGMGLCAIAASTSTGSVFTAKLADITRRLPPDYIGQFGKRLTGLFLRVLMSTTRTKTRATTASKTSNCSHAAPTRFCISSKRSGLTATRLGKTLSHRERGIQSYGWRVTSTASSAATSTTAALLTRLGSVLQSALNLQGLEPLPANSGSVSSAALRMTLLGACNGIVPSGATLEQQRRGRRLTLLGMWRAVHVACFSQASGPMPASAHATAPSTSTQAIVSVERLAQRADVYDIAVDGASEFFANGILVHNCDELAKFRYARETWDQLQFGLRLGKHPRQIITTTPRPIPILKEILAAATTVVTRGVTSDNASNLAPSFIKTITDKYAGTRLGRQELSAEILDDVPDALWTRAALDRDRRKPGEIPALKRIVVAIDPAAKKNEIPDDGAATGIVVAGVGDDGRGYVLDDATCRESPNGWARMAVACFDRYEADCVVGEINNGGDMVETTVRAVRPTVPFREVTASRGKWTRAEPIAALYEQGRVSHVGTFASLEDEMVNFGPNGLVGDASPDRVDALVWALTELFPAMTRKITKAEPKPRTIPDMPPDRSGNGWMSA